MKKVKFNGIDRAVIPTILKTNSGTELEQITIKELLNKTRFKPGDIIKLGLTELKNGSITWDQNKHPEVLTEVEYELSPQHIAVLKDALSHHTEHKLWSQSNLDTLQKIKKF